MLKSFNLDPIPNNLQGEEGAPTLKRGRGVENKNLPPLFFLFVLLWHKLIFISFTQKILHLSKNPTHSRGESITTFRSNAVELGFFFKMTTTKWRVQFSLGDPQLWPLIKTKLSFCRIEIKCCCRHHRLNIEHH